MVSTRSGITTSRQSVKRKGSFDAEDTQASTIESIKKALIDAEIISPKKIPNDRQLHLLHKRYKHSQHKRVKFDVLPSHYDEAGLSLNQKAVDGPSRVEPRKVANTQPTVNFDFGFSDDDHASTHSSDEEESPLSIRSHRLSANDLVTPALERVADQPTGPQPPIWTARDKQKWKARERSASIRSNREHSNPTATDTPTCQRIEGGAHPSTRLTSANSRSSRRSLQTARQDQDSENKDPDHGLMDYNSDTSQPQRSPRRTALSTKNLRTSRTRAQNPFAVVDSDQDEESDDTLDEDSDEPQPRRNCKNRTRPTSPDLGRDLLSRISISREVDSPSIHLDDLQPSEIEVLSHPTVQKIISSIQTTSDQNRDETRELTKTLQRLTHVVERLAHTSAPRTTPRQSSDEEPHSRSPRGGPFSRAVRDVMNTLLGQKKTEKILPHPASPAQMRLWRINVSLKEMIAGNVEDMEIDLPPETGNPDFPYPGGPGKEDANPVVLRIMWRTMKSLGVDSYRPAFQRPQSSPENAFLWRVAAAIIIKLIRCGEIQGLTAEESEPKKVLARVKMFAKETLFRRYRQHQKWSVAHTQKQTKRKARYSRWYNIKQARELYTMSRDHLWPLTKIIPYCCSDDETDVDAEAEEGRGKVCKVRNLSWRNPALGKILQAIDESRVRRVGSSRPAGKPPTTRIRGPDNPSNEAPAPPDLNVDCYCPNFLAGLEPGDRLELNIDPTPILEPLKDLCDRGLI